MEKLGRICGQVAPVVIVIGVPLICLDAGLSIMGVVGGLFVGIGLSSIILLLQEENSRKR